MALMPIRPAQEQPVSGRTHQVTGWADPFSVVDLAGVLANAILGGIIARRARFDPIGAAVLALLSGLGGGVVRDTILQSGAPAAFHGYEYISVALIGGALGYAMPPENRAWQLCWPLVDAVALGTWASTGALKALVNGLPWLPAIVVGTVGAIGGGMIRDIVLRRVPTVLGGNTLYATCAVLAAAGEVALDLLGLHRSVSLAGATLVGGALCLLARWRGWILPARDGLSWRRPPAGSSTDQI